MFRHKGQTSAKYPELHERIAKLPPKDQDWIAKTFDSLHQDFQHAQEEIERQAPLPHTSDPLANIPHGTLHRVMPDAEYRDFKYQTPSGYFLQPTIRRGPTIDGQQIQRRPSTAIEVVNGKPQTRLKIVVPTPQMHEEKLIQYAVTGSSSRPKTASRGDL
eukprot:TRINITY_DN1667_c0_g2_i1.p1 TRINITY_DN1667_c0_g2~~TRINITY_DN1667_c0_g2_i1.p1  ORF type:complete len:160 (-),score=34.92 TRINITY_DN1667_c0_g2_i1:331-810(-)